MAVAAATAASTVAVARKLYRCHVQRASYNHFHGRRKSMESFDSSSSSSSNSSNSTSNNSSNSSSSSSNSTRHSCNSDSSSNGSSCNQSGSSSNSSSSYLHSDGFIKSCLNIFHGVGDLGACSVVQHKLIGNKLGQAPFDCALSHWDALIGYWADGGLQKV